MVAVSKFLSRLMYSRISSEEGSSIASEPLLEDVEDEKFVVRLERRKSVWPWMASTFMLSIILLVVLILDYPLSPRQSYETGFATDLQAGVHVIEVEERKFWGGIKVNSNGTFYQSFNPDEDVRYVGPPTPQLDAAWDRLVGTFVALSKEESESIRGAISDYKGGYLATTSGQHQIHCLNYLRQCLYDEHYPEVHVHREHIPDYYLHIDHCIDTLRQSIQCASDMTPVPKAWEPITGIYLANTEMVHTCRKYENVVGWTEERFDALK